MTNFVKKALADIPMVEKVMVEKTKLIVEIQTGAHAEDLNKILVDQGIYLSHLLAKEKSLEKFFLEITNKNHV